MKILKSFVRRRRERRLANASPEEIFTRYYHKNSWGDPESASGKGSNLEVTAQLRAHLPAVLRAHNVTSMLDVPCGDFNWMREVDLEGIDYFGGDIVAALIEANRKYERAGRQFGVVNLISDSLPKADLVFTRDCLVHLSFSDATRAIRNIIASGPTFLMATNFPETAVNADILTGQWRPLDLCKAPFFFPKPLAVIDEGFRKTDGSHADKSMALWQVADLKAINLSL